MNDFPVEEFAKAQSFSVQGNSIQFRSAGKTVILSFESEGELFTFLKAWAGYLHENTRETAPRLPNQPPVFTGARASPPDFPK
jgi:hypothetical protein